MNARPLLLIVDDDGDAVANALRALRRAPNTRAVPVVMLSTSSPLRDTRRADELGANSDRVKRGEPADPGALIAQAAPYRVEFNRVSQAGSAHVLPLRFGR